MSEFSETKRTLNKTIGALREVIDELKGEETHLLLFSGEIKFLVEEILSWWRIYVSERDSVVLMDPSVQQDRWTLEELTEEKELFSASLVQLERYGEILRNIFRKNNEHKWRTPKGNRPAFFESIVEHLYEENNFVCETIGEIWGIKSDCQTDELFQQTICANFRNFCIQRIRKTKRELEKTALKSPFYETEKGKTPVLWRDLLRDRFIWMNKSLGRKSGKGTDVNLWENEFSVDSPRHYQWIVEVLEKILVPDEICFINRLDEDRASCEALYEILGINDMDYVFGIILRHNIIVGEIDPEQKKRFQTWLLGNEIIEQHCEEEKVSILIHDKAKNKQEIENRLREMVKKYTLRDLCPMLEAMEQNHEIYHLTRKVAYAELLRLGLQKKKKGNSKDSFERYYKA